MSLRRESALALRRREVVTPEGVPVRFEVALAGDRVGALALDLLAVLGLLVALGAPAVFLMLRGLLPPDVGLGILVLLLFLIRTFYFAAFELAWGGQTPGKRRVGIRAVDAAGGPLRAEAVLARNLTREFEIFLPFAAVAAPRQLFPGAPGWAVLAATIWVLLFGLLPLFNRDRLRVGDLVAGTIVVREPAPLLLPDLSAGAAEAYAFTTAQLDVYGVYELQVLEDVLRATGDGRGDGLLAVRDTIVRRIGWGGPPPAAEPFLVAFYAALRGRLEARLLLGHRKADKSDPT